MKTVIEMAREADACHDDVQITPFLERFAELVRADERKIRAHSLGHGEMELSLRRNHKDDLYECRRRFSATEVMHGPDFMIEKVAKQLDAEIDRAIRAGTSS